jgi:hypothetical protein
LKAEGGCRSDCKIKTILGQVEKSHTFR